MLICKALKAWKDFLHHDNFYLNLKLSKRGRFTKFFRACSLNLCIPLLINTYMYKNKYLSKRIEQTKRVTYQVSRTCGLSQVCGQVVNFNFPGFKSY